MAKKDHTAAEILALIEQEEASAYGINDAELSQERADAIGDYLGDPNRYPAPDGRSQVVSYDTQDTIESALPQLLKIFISGDQVVKFEPRGPEDQQAAEQETDFVNYIVMEKNPGFHVFATWFKDALLSKNAYVKVWAEEEIEDETETYNGLTDNQLAMVLSDGGKNIEVLEHTAYPDEIALQQMQANAAQMMQMGAPIMPPPQLHDIKIRITEKKTCIKVCPVAPEDIMVSTDCREVSVKNARFVQHRKMESLSELEEQGYKIPADFGSYDRMNYDNESNARDLYGEDGTRDNDLADQVLVRDTYYRLNGELKRYVIVGSHILDESDCEVMPFATITPHIMPHRHIGRSYADLVKDIQQIKTALVRGQLDNMYLSNNGRYAISDRVNLEDMLTSRPGGVVRVQGDPGGNIMPFVHPPLPSQSFSMVEYLDSAKEKRTGVTAYNQGLDSNSLNKTATGINIISNAAQERLSLVARTFAETGVKELFMLVHRLVRKHYTRPEMIRLRNEWVEVDPREWKSRADMSIAVGLGTGNKDQQLMHLSNMFQMSGNLMPMGVVTPINMYNLMRQLYINAGFKNPDEFLSNPSQQPPQQPPPDPNMLKMQADQQKAQADMQMKQADMQLSQQLEQQKLQAEMALEAQKLQFEREKAQMQMQTQIEIAKIKAGMDLEASMLQTQSQMQLKDAEVQRAQSTDGQAKTMQTALQQVSQMVADLQKQIEAQKGAQIVGIKRVRGPDGRLAGGIQVRADGTETPISIQ